MSVKRDPFLALALMSALVLGGAVWAATGEVRELEWDDLMPADWMPKNPLEGLSDEELAGLLDGSEQANRLLEQYLEVQASAPVVGELDGETVRLPGFVVPLEFTETAVSEFLLVPYFGACIHVPPPPSNQIVYVQTAKPYDIRGLFEAVWVTGRLRTSVQMTELADAGYTLEATTVEPYE